jgi:adenylate kinase
MNVSQGTPLGLQAKAYMDRGDLVPDDVTVDMVRMRLVEPDAAEGFLLDGFPRTVPQAQILDDILADAGIKLDVVLELVVDDDEVIRGRSGRRTCRSCNHIWHVDFDPPAVPDVCDIDGGELYQRDDDRAATIANRLQVYSDATSPLVNYYAGRGLLVGIDATGPVDDVTQRAIDALRPLHPRG